MNFKSITLFSSLALASIASAPAVAEPTLNSILQTIDATTWSQTTLSALTGSSWNTSGSVLNFTLASENTSWAPTQTFSITDSGSHLLFAGAATNGATYSYTLTSALSGYTFATTSGSFVADLSKIFVSSTGKYVIAHEDWTDNDYNDMVISFSVTPVPEPTTYAMLLAGMVGLGFAARKKKQD